MKTTGTYTFCQLLDDCPTIIVDDWDHTPPDPQHKVLLAIPSDQKT